jgi:hypothetical protein
MTMINAVPHTEYDLEFNDSEPMPLYVFYCLLGQEYETYRNDPELLTMRGIDADYVLDTLHTLLNGFPEQETSYYNDRVFNVRCGGRNDSDVKLARACFYFEGSNLYCNIQNAHYCGNNSCHTRIKYDPAFRCSWELDELEWYGLVNVEEECDD